MKTYDGPEWHNEKGEVFRLGEIYLTGALKYLPHGILLMKVDTRNGMDRYRIVGMRENVTEFVISES